MKNKKDENTPIRIALRLVSAGGPEMLPATPKPIQAELYVASRRLGAPGAPPIVVQRQIDCRVRFENNVPTLRMVGYAKKEGKKFAPEAVLPMDHEVVRELQTAPPVGQLDGLLPAVWRVADAAHPLVGSPEVREHLQALKKLPEFDRLQQAQLEAGRVMLGRDVAPELPTLGYAVQGTAAAGSAGIAYGTVPWAMMSGTSIPARGLQIQLGAFWNPAKSNFGRAILV